MQNENISWGRRPCVAQLSSKTNTTPWAVTRPALESLELEIHMNQVAIHSNSHHSNNEILGKKN